MIIPAPQPQAVEKARAERRRLLSVLGSPDGQQLLADLELRFETHLPVFQGRPGAYDPLDAMRRDAHREVFLVIRHQLELARKESLPTEYNTIHNHE